MRRRGRRSVRDPILPVVCAAFGLGLFLALFGSFKLALVIAAVAIIYLGICHRPC